MNKDDLKDIKNQVIAGAIIFLLITLGTYLLGLWSKITDFFVIFKNWLGELSYIYNWLLILLFLFSIFFIIERFKFRNRFKKSQDAEITPEEIGPTRLDKIQEDILLYLSENENHLVVWENINNYFPNIQQTKLRYHLDQLREGYYIKYDSFYHCYSLGHLGRAYLVNNSLI